MYIRENDPKRVRLRGCSANAVVRLQPRQFRGVNTLVALGDTEREREL